MQLLLRRTTLTGQSTIGELFVDGNLQCYTLEQVFRELPGEAVSDWKVPDVTAIPLGTYQLSLATFHPKTNPEANPPYTAPLLQDVEDFDGVFIHIGNSPTDTEGCILVGTQPGSDWVDNSRDAFALLFQTIKDELTAGGCSLTIEMQTAVVPQMRKRVSSTKRVSRFHVNAHSKDKPK